MDAQRIAQSPLVERFFHFESIDSTNTFAKNLDAFPASGLFVILADKQTAGRGQRDNSFFSGAGGGLYATVVCPIADMALHFVYNRALTLAICDAVERMHPGAALSIKWPNDIFWSNRKLCGILLETSPRSAAHLIAGFGVNVNIPEERFPECLRSAATSMFMQTGKRFDAAALLLDICERFCRYLSADRAAVHEKYREKLYKVGCRIGINGAAGRFQTVLEDGRLCLNENGNLNYFLSGPMHFID